MDPDDYGCLSYYWAQNVEDFINLAKFDYSFNDAPGQFKQSVTFIVFW